MSDMHEHWADAVLPQRWVHRDLFVGEDDGGDLQFGFVNGDYAQQLSGRTIKEIVNNHLPPETVIDRSRGVRFDRPETPLDLGVKGGGASLYVIFRIVGPANMTFRPNSRAISHKQATTAERSRYGLIRHKVTANNHSSVAGEECKIVYFACKPGSSLEFRDSFNLHVRFQQKTRADPERERFLDIIIDPDVGYPGGSAVEP